MATRVIHFGWSDCCRVLLLRAAGFDVKGATSLNEFIVALQSRKRWDAVVLSENTAQSAEEAANIAVRRFPAPLLLFRNSLRPINEKRFNRIYPPFTPPELWLPDIVALIGEGYARSGRRLSGCIVPSGIMPRLEPELT